MPSLEAPSSPPAVEVLAGDLRLTGRVKEDGTFWLELVGEFDLMAKEAFTEVISSPPGRSGAAVIDLSGLRFIDSIGIAALLRASSRAEVARQDLRFVRGTKAVARILELTGVEDLLRYLD